MRCIYTLALSIVAVFGTTVWGADTDRDVAAYITTAHPVTILCANDGEMRVTFTGSGVRHQPVKDSITVVYLGPDHPPVSKTVVGSVPVTIYGSPRVAMTADGRYGFVTNHGSRLPEVPESPPVQLPSEQLVNVLTAIDLTTDDLKVIGQVKFPTEPWMAAMHPDGAQVIVAAGTGFRIFAVENSRLVPRGEATAPSTVCSFDVSPRGDLIVAVTCDSPMEGSNPQLHLFDVKGNTITHRQRIEAVEGVGATMDRLFSPRISPDGKTALVAQDRGEGGKGSLDDVLLVDLDRDVAAVTGRIAQVGDGLESITFHPSGRFAVVACLEAGLDLTQVSHLAVIDLTTHPARLLSHTPVELIPEGMEFTADGSQLFVGITAAHHIAVFDVVGFTLRRSPFVLRTGHGPSALAVVTHTESSGRPQPPAKTSD